MSPAIELDRSQTKGTHHVFQDDPTFSGTTQQSRNQDSQKKTYYRHPQAQQHLM